MSADASVVAAALALEVRSQGVSLVTNTESKGYYDAYAGFLSDRDHSVGKCPRFRLGRLRVANARRRSNRRSNEARRRCLGRHDAHGPGRSLGANATASAADASGRIRSRHALGRAAKQGPQLSIRLESQIKDNFLISLSKPF